MHLGFLSRGENGFSAIWDKEANPHVKIHTIKSLGGGGGGEAMGGEIVTYPLLPMLPSIDPFQCALKWIGSWGLGYPPCTPTHDCIAQFMTSFTCTNK